MSVFSLNRTEASRDISTNAQPRPYSCRASIMARNSSCVARGDARQLREQAYDGFSGWWGFTSHLANDIRVTNDGTGLRQRNQVVVTLFEVPDPY